MTKSATPYGTSLTFSISYFLSLCKDTTIFLDTKLFKKKKSLQIFYGFFPLDGIILPTGRQDNAIPKHKTLRREPSSDSLNHQKEIELGFIWIWNEAQVNFNRATRKLCLSLKPVWTEAYFNGKWSLLQWQTKPISMTDEAYFKCRWSLFSLLHQ